MLILGDYYSKPVKMAVKRTNVMYLITTDTDKKESDKIRSKLESLGYTIPDEYPQCGWKIINAKTSKFGENEDKNMLLDITKVIESKPPGLTLLAIILIILAGMIGVCATSIVKKIKNN